MGCCPSTEAPATNRRSSQLVAVAPSQTQGVQSSRRSSDDVNDEEQQSVRESEEDEEAAIEEEYQKQQQKIMNSLTELIGPEVGAARVKPRGADTRAAVAAVVNSNNLVNCDVDHRAESSGGAKSYSIGEAERSCAASSTGSEFVFPRVHSSSSKFHSPLLLDKTDFIEFPVGTPSPAILQVVLPNSTTRTITGSAAQPVQVVSTTNAPKAREGTPHPWGSLSSTGSTLSKSAASSYNQGSSWQSEPAAMLHAAAAPPNCGGAATSETEQDVSSSSPRRPQLPQRGVVAVGVYGVSLDEQINHFELVAEDANPGTLCKEPEDPLWWAEARKNSDAAATEAAQKGLAYDDEELHRHFSPPSGVLVSSVVIWKQGIQLFIPV